MKSSQIDDDEPSIVSAVEFIPISKWAVDTNEKKVDDPSPVKKDQKNPWKFNLNRDLSGAELSRLPNEEILASWRFSSSSMSHVEWVASFLTFGLYYFCTRILLKRNRKYAIHVTEKSVFVKEEMFESRCGCTSMLMENQITFPIKNLAYICSDDTKPRLCGIIPESVSLGMRFSRFPTDSEMAESSNLSLFELFLKRFSEASSYGMENAFGINFDSNPIELATQLSSAVPRMAGLHRWMVFGVYFTLNLLQQIHEGICQMIKAAKLDPSIGPRMVIGAQDATSFHIEADIEEDPDCRAHMKSILQALANHLPDREVIRESIRPRVKGSIIRIREGEPLAQLNNKKKYAEGDNYVLLEDYVYLSESETIYDVCESNPYITSTDWKRIFFTLGLYYFTDLSERLSHRKNIFFTKLRCIHHSVLLSGDGNSVEHSRLEYWINDQLTNMAVIDFKGSTTFRADTENSGWISFQMTRTNQDFMMFVFRTLFRASFEPPKTQGLTFMTREEWFSDENLKNSTLTASAFTETENIDTAIYSKQYLFTIVEYILGCCCLLNVPEASVTATDETLYVEQYASSFFSSSRLFVCLPWCDVDGVYWQNFDARGPTGIMYYCTLLLVLLLCIFVPCVGLPACVYYCCSCCASAPENNDTYDDVAYGQKGSRVRICAAKNASFHMGINLPTKYYGVRNAIIDSVVDSIVSRALKAKHEMTTQLHGEINESHLASISSQSVGNFTNSSISSPISGFYQLTEEGNSDETVSALHQNSSKEEFNPVESSQPDDTFTADDNNTSIVAQAVAVQPSPVGTPVVQVISGGPVHYTQYVTQKSRSMNQSTEIGMNLNFPMNPPNMESCQSLMPGENVICGWCFETSLLETWQVVYYFLTFGIGYFYHNVFHQYRTFTSFYVTQDRILIQEEIWNQEYCCTNRIMENEVSFMISDISYINVVELSSRWCGLLPARTWLEIRFGEYPAVTEDPPGLGRFPSLTGNPKLSMIEIAHLYAMSAVYGINEMNNPTDAMHAYLTVAKTTGFLTATLNDLNYFFRFSIGLLSQFFSILRSLLIWCIYGSQTDDHAVGPKLVDGTLNGRRHFVGFQTSHAPHVAKEFIQLVTQLNASKVSPMKPSVELDGLSPGERFDYSLEPDNPHNGLLQSINDTNIYKNGEKEFHILKRLWSLLSDEIVYDVTPFNPSIVWNCTNLTLTMMTAGLYYFLVLWPKLLYKKSYMITNRRLIRHITRSSTYSNLEIWFLVPISSYTLVEKERLSCCCCHDIQYELITDSSRFGPFTFFLPNGSFMKTVLKVVSGRMKEYFTPNRNNQLALTRQDLINIPEAGSDCFTNEFIADIEIIECATGVTLPLSCLSRSLCCRKPLHFIFALTNAAIYLECYQGTIRMFTCLPWDEVGGIYWSNYQPYSSICFWLNSETYSNKLYGHAGAQLHFHTKDSKSFSLGLNVPHRYVGVDKVINEFIATMQQRIHGETTEDDEELGK